MNYCRHQALLPAITLALLGACSSVTYKKAADPQYSICSGRQASKKYDFTVSFHVQVPKGILVSEVQAYLDRNASARDEISSKLVDYLLVRYLVETPKDIRWEGDPIASYQFPKGAPFSENFIRTGPFNFVSCGGDRCDGLIDPVSGARVQAKTYTHFGHSGRLNQTCAWIYSEATQDPAPPESTQYEGCNISIFDQGRFIQETGFNPGAYLSDKYLQVPEREQDSICRLAGMNAGCFKLPENNDQLEEFRGKLTGHGLVATDALLHKYLYHCDDHYRVNRKWINQECLDQLKQDFKERIVLRHALASEIALQSSKRISKKVQGDWIIHRIEWDPSLFCKYAQPTSDLYTH